MSSLKEQIEKDQKKFDAFPQQLKERLLADLRLMRYDRQQDMQRRINKQRRDNDN